MGEIIVQTGNLLKQPEVGKASEWKVTQEWKLKVSSGLNPEELTTLISTACASGTKMWPHEISIVGEEGKLTVLRQSKDDIGTIGIGNGTLLRFWNGKWEV